MKVKKFTAKDFQQHVNMLKKRAHELVEIFKQFDGPYKELYERYDLFTTEHHNREFRTSIIVKNERYWLHYSCVDPDVRIIPDCDRVSMIIPDHIVEDAKDNDVAIWFWAHMEHQQRERAAQETYRILRHLKQFTPERRTAILDSITDEAFKDEKTLRAFCENLHGVTK